MSRPIPIGPDWLPATDRRLFQRNSGKEFLAVLLLPEIKLQQMIIPPRESVVSTAAPWAERPLLANMVRWKRIA